MVIIFGLLVLIAAVVVGVAGVAANTGEVRTDTSDFGVFDYHFTASAGELFLYGMAVGAIGMLGLSMLLAGLWRSSRRNSATRRELRRSRKEVAAAKSDVTPRQPAAQQPPKQPIPAAVTTTEPAVPSAPKAAPSPGADTKPGWNLNRFLPKAAESRKPVDASAK